MSLASYQLLHSAMFTIFFRAFLEKRCKGTTIFLNTQIFMRLFYFYL